MNQKTQKRKRSAVDELARATAAADAPVGLAPSPLASPWVMNAQFARHVERGDGMRLAVMVQQAPGGFMVIALATAAPAGDVAAVFDDHHHSMVGTYPEPVEAFGAAESYAAAWVKKYKATGLEGSACDCGPIDAEGSRS